MHTTPDEQGQLRSKEEISARIASVERHKQHHPPQSVFDQ
jgi:hypothetical protein